MRIVSLESVWFIQRGIGSKAQLGAKKGNWGVSFAPDRQCTTFELHQSEGLKLWGLATLGEVDNNTVLWSNNGSRDELIVLGYEGISCKGADL